MIKKMITLGCVIATIGLPVIANAYSVGPESGPGYNKGLNVRVGPRSYFLVQEMQDGR
jgi:hypothetical protein